MPARARTGRSMAKAAINPVTAPANSPTGKPLAIVPSTATRQAASTGKTTQALGNLLRKSTRIDLPHFLGKTLRANL